MEKYYYSINEVAKLFQVKTSVLRYWEKMFKILKPRKSNGNRRIYTKKDIEIIKIIKFLLYEKKYTIKGAQQTLKNREAVEQLQLEFKEKIDNSYIIKKLKNIVDILKK